MDIKKIFGDKRRYRAYKERVAQLPASYRTAVEGLARYLMYTGAQTEDPLLSMLEDLADLFEQAAADATPIREIVGDDAIDFAEAFKQNYGLSRWLSKEQQRLTDAINSAERHEEPTR